MQVVIIGAGGFCKQVIDIFELNKISIRGLLDDHRTESLFEYPVIGTIKNYCPIEDDYLFCAIGNVKLRKEIYQVFPDRWINCVHPTADVSKYATIGNGNYVGPGSCLMPGAIIGNNNIIDPLVVVSHDVSIGDHNHLAAHTCLLGRVIIKDCNLLGANSTILPNLTVGSNNILGAGAVNTKSISNNKIMIGIPAREQSLK